MFIVLNDGYVHRDSVTTVITEHKCLMHWAVVSISYKTEKNIGSLNPTYTSIRANFALSARPELQQEVWYQTFNTTVSTSHYLLRLRSLHIKKKVVRLNMISGVWYLIFQEILGFHKPGHIYIKTLILVSIYDRCFPSNNYTSLSLNVRSL